MSELLVRGPGLGEDATFEATHVEEKVWVVFGIHRDKGVLPLDGGDGTRETVFDVPEHRPMFQRGESLTW